MRIATSLGSTMVRSMLETLPSSMEQFSLGWKSPSLISKKAHVNYSMMCAHKLLIDHANGSKCPAILGKALPELGSDETLAQNSKVHIEVGEGHAQAAFQAQLLHTILGFQRWGREFD